MLRLGFGGEDLVARVLARAGWKVSARSVRRMGRESQASNPTPTIPIGGRLRNPVVARFVNHVWMMDVSVVQAFLGGELYLGAVFDAFSRAPLAMATFERRPGASAMARLLKTAARTFGWPKYLITDQGGEFTGSVFAKTVARLGVVQRFGSTQNIFATARIERFWRTLKQASSLRLHPPLTIGDLERRLELALTHYLCFRPHQGLLGATPGDAFLGLAPASPNAVSPPRGRPGEGPSRAPFVIEFLDPEQRDFPFLKAA
jgi:transposase InsO family protein